jgi:hypothetical protein
MTDVQSHSMKKFVHSECFLCSLQHEVYETDTMLCVECKELTDISDPLTRPSSHNFLFVFFTATFGPS